VHLTDEEAQRLRNSAKTISEVQSQLGLWGQWTFVLFVALCR
jgi:hypothetical protein